MLTRIAVFVSGGGTNLQALIDAQNMDVLRSGRIQLVVSSNPAAFALERAAKAGGMLCAVFDGANEQAAELFLKGKCGFTEITDLIENAMSRCKNIENPSLEDIFAADREARRIVKESD